MLRLVLVLAFALPVVWPTMAWADDPVPASPAATTLHAGLTRGALVAALRASHYPTTIYPYDTARDTLFARVDIELGDSLRGAYTGRALWLDPSADPTAYAFSHPLNISTEHSWPQSRGAVEGTDGYSDMHHLFPVLQNVNASRSNLPYADFTAADGTVWYGPSGTQSTAPTNLGDYSARSSALSRFEPRDAVKGDVARALFYFATMHDSNADYAWFELQRPTLLAWHAADPADAAELARSNAIATYQGTDNPFVMDATLAERAFGDGNYVVTNPRPDVVWINEIHYDNAGADQNEGVEVLGSSGGRLDGYVLYCYRSDGTIYDQTSLSGVLADEGEGHGTLWNAMPGLQNGPADGLALVDPDGTVLQFLSYEGTLTATEGPASGQTSTDVGPMQPSNTPIGQTLQLTGTGQQASNFTWSGPQTSSKGAVNSGQSFGALPVELIAFEAVASEDRIHLTWATASETNNAGFAIEWRAGQYGQSGRSDWSEAAFVTGYGTTLLMQTYRHTLHSLLPGTYRLRLRQVDFDGTTDYSPEVEATVQPAGFGLALSTPAPNPAHSTTAIAVTAPADGLTDLSVYDLLGRRVFADRLMLRGGEASRQRLDVTTWSAGVYLIRMHQDERIATARLVVAQ
ncbi:MAG: endonuclease [Bacteroidota bacterium]